MLGTRPIGPQTVGEREIAAATLETSAILGIIISKWKRGKLPTSRVYSWPCWYASIPDNDSVLLVYLPSQPHGLCCLITCGEHYHLRPVTSLATLGEMLRWNGVDCMQEKLASEEDKRTLEMRLR